MRAFCLAFFTLFLAFNLHAQSFKSYANISQIDYDKIDFSGDWQFIDKNFNNRTLDKKFLIHIEKASNGDYIGYYDYQSKKNKSNKKNKSIVVNRKSKDELALVMFDEQGNMVEGVLSLHSNNKLQWQSKKTLGARFVPKTAIMNNDGRLLYELRDNTIQLPLKSEEMNRFNFKVFKLNETLIKLKQTPENQSNTYLAHIKSNVPRMAVYMLTEVTKNRERQYIISVNPEGNEVDRIALDLSEVESVQKKGLFKRKKQRKLTSFEIDEKMNVCFNMNSSFQNKKKSKIKQSIRYELQHNGKFLKIEPDSKPKRKSSGSLKYNKV